MATLTQAPATQARRRRHAGRGPLTGPLLLFAAGGADRRRLCRLRAVAALAGRAGRARCAVAADHRGGVAFNIPPAAIRMPVQRRPGTQERVDLAFLWPSLTPPDPALKPPPGAPVDPTERLFVTIAASDGTLPPIERVQDDLSALSGAGAGRRAGRAHAARLPRRHALSGRGSGLRAGRAGAFPGPLHAQGRRPLPARACRSGASAAPTSRCAFRATG